MSRLIRSLPNKSSPLDLIPTSTLKRFSHLFAPIISKLNNFSFSQAIFPAFFKTAQVLPLLKKGNLDPTIPSNYRPISNLSTISKIIEKLVHSRITSHVSSSPNFNPFQSAYRKHHSTKTTLLRITDSLRNICATGHAAVLVSLDLSTTLPIFSKLKILGVTLDSNLSFAHFISQIIQSSNFHIYAIKQVRKFLPLSTANALFISLVLSRLDYCNSLLCGQPNYLLCKLQALQNHAAKTVLQADYFSSSSDCLDRLHWLPVFQGRKFKLLWLIACTLKFEQPAYLFDLLSIRHTRQPLRYLHSGLQLHQPVSSGLFTSRSFFHQAPRLWNSLPSNLRSSPSLMNFRKLLKTHLYHKHPQS